MKTFALLLSLCAGMLGPTYAVRAQSMQPPPHDVQAAFDYACYATQYDCSSVTQLTVMWVWEIAHPTLGPLDGGYDGGDTIYLSGKELRTADPVYTQSVLVHEFVHYLDTKLGYSPTPWTKEILCATEARAWRHGNVYLITHGRPDLTDFSWFVRYQCYQ